MITIERRQNTINKVNVTKAMLDYMIACTNLGNTHLPEQTANLLWQNGLISSYYDIENALRQRGNEQIYFFGAPLSYIQSQLPEVGNYRIRYPVSSIRNTFISPKFALIIESKGKEAAKLQRQDLGISVYENLENLKRTGILFPKNKVEEFIVFTR